MQVNSKYIIITINLCVWEDYGTFYFILFYKHMDTCNIWIHIRI
jgi:hypothetical protein